MLIRSIAYNEETSAKREKDEDDDMVTLNNSENKFLKKVRADGGDFSRIFMRMQERSKRMQSQLQFNQGNNESSGFRIRTTTHHGLRDKSVTAFTRAQTS